MKYNKYPIIYSILQEIEITRTKLHKNRISSTNGCKIINHGELI